VIGQIEIDVALVEQRAVFLFDGRLGGREARRR
jgi:hypothetical protein